MAAPATINVTKINAADIEFSDPKKNKNNGSVSIGLKYKSQNVQFRIPQVSFPGGLQVRDNENKDGSTTTSYMLSASMTGGDPYNKSRVDETSETAKLYNFMHDFEEHIVQTAVKNSSKWFGKVRSADSIRDTFNRFISMSVDKVDNVWVPNGKYPPSLRLKLPVYDGKDAGRKIIAMEAIDSEGNDVPLTVDNLVSVFSKGSSAKMILQASIYISGQGFGITWKPTYAEVHQRKRQTARDLFKDDEDDAEVVKPKTEYDEADEVDEETTEKDDDEVDVQLPAPTSAAPAPAAASSGDAKPARRRKVA
jgi:hypothetical protein